MEQRLAKAMADAGSFTFMHVDHATPPAISDKFLDGVQGVLAGAMSPEEAMTLTENEADSRSRQDQDADVPRRQVKAGASTVCRARPPLVAA